MTKTKVKWAETPFIGIKEAFNTAERMGLRPMPITSTELYHSFSLHERNKTVLIAQKVDPKNPSQGTGPVLEKETSGKTPLPKREGPSFSEDVRLQVGPWTRSDLGTLEEVETYWKKQYVNFDNVEVLQIVLYRIGGDEYEYAKDAEGLWTRVLHERKSAAKK